MPGGRSVPILPAAATACTTPARAAPAPRCRGRPPKNPAPDQPSGSPASPLAAAEAEVIGDYEREWAARIQENMERMQELGILDHVQTLSYSAAASGRGTGSVRCRRKPMEPGSAAGPG